MWSPPPTQLIDNVFAARASPELALEPLLVEGGAAVSRAISRGQLAVVRSHRDVCTAEGVDVVIDATGNPNVGAEVALATIAAGKHIVMMNVEADVTIGAYLAAKAASAGVVYTLGAGDEPSATMELINFVRGLGYPIVAAGKSREQRVSYRCDARRIRGGSETAQHESAHAGRVCRRQRRWWKWLRLPTPRGSFPTSRACIGPTRRWPRCTRCCARAKKAACCRARVSSISPYPQESPRAYSSSPKCAIAPASG
jgi:hypothetical protein